MNEKVLTVTHNDVEIHYHEGADKWMFELRGRQRSAESLIKAREAIDKPYNPKEEKPPFERVECYWHNGSWAGAAEWDKVTVTSLVDSERVWITDKDQRRRMEYVRRLYPVTPDNDKIVAKLKENATQFKALREKTDCLLRTLKPLKTT